MKKLADIIDSLSQQLDPPDPFYQGLLERIWPRVVGDRLAACTRAGPFEDGRLTVFVRNSYWHQHLEGSRRDIRDRVAQFLPAGRLQEVVLVSSPRRFKPGTDAEAGTREAAAGLPDWAQNCLCRIQDSKVRAAFGRALLSHWQAGPRGE